MSSSTAVVIGPIVSGSWVKYPSIGIRRRVRYMAVTPTFGPRYVGIGVGGRF